ncbi:hypothetical protein [Acidovorax sp. SUPP3334]|uniref:hypothetical protein n=1 Tax=Acidovorax sp. SUPP3334 TaxID=2920881 RepID=UPI0023DE36F6|nr:hypothetical protein [Acidovorax sp. SUPP3334]GKT21215.1 hypothetical protein AVHM3334_04030 [Acidovorax sp. SUPP3334]
MTSCSNWINSPARNLLPLILLGATASCVAQTRDVTGEIAVSSDLTERGFQTPIRRPIVQGLVTLYDATGWSAGAVLGMQTNGRRYGRAIVRLAYDGVLSNDWQYQAVTQYYAYPDNPTAQLLDRLETGLSFSYRDLIVAGASVFRYPHTIDRARPMRWALDMGGRLPLDDQFSLTSTIGLAQVRPQGRYAYGSVGLAWRQGPWRATLSYLTADSRANSVYPGNVAGNWSFMWARSF